MHFLHINWTWDVSAGQILTLISTLLGLYQVNKKSRERSQAITAKIGLYHGAITSELQPKKAKGDPKAHTEPMPFKPNES